MAITIYDTPSDDRFLGSEYHMVHSYAQQGRPVFRQDKQKTSLCEPATSSLATPAMPALVAS